MNAAKKLPPPETPDMFPELVSLAPPPADMAAANAELSQIAPGVWVSGVPEFETPSHVICKLVPGKTPGTYTLEPEPYPGYVRMTDDIGDRLGVIGLSNSTLRRLMWAGFVEHIRAAPGCLFISIESLLSHFRATKNDLGREVSFWNRGRREKWKETYEPVSNID